MNIIYEVNRDYTGAGVPRMVEVIPIATVTNLDSPAGAWFSIARQQLVDEVRSVIHGYNGWDNHRIDRNVFGLLQMANLDYPFTTKTIQITPERITTDLMFHIFQQVVLLYNTDLRPFHVSWTFIIPPTEIHAGSGRGSRETDGLYLPTCRNYDQVSCAAFAVMFWRVMNEDQFDHYRRHINRTLTIDRIIDLAKEFQTRMGWEKSVTLNQILKIVDLDEFKDLRVVILNPGLLGATGQECKQGVLYDFDEDRTSSTSTNMFPKTMYLFYDHEFKHYCTVKAAQKFLRNYLKNSTIDWCHECLSRLCCCGDVLQKAKNQKRKRGLCKDCGQETYNLSQHHCGKQRCTECFGEYRRGKEMNDHRCPIKLNLDNIPLDFESGNPKAKNLIVFDLECFIEEKEGDLSSYEWCEDEEGYYIEGEDGLPVNRVTSVHKQMPNFVAYMNVFTGEMRKSTRSEDFLLDVLTGVNGGNNICIAHNASGYDSRIIFDELLRLTKVEPKIIRRGTKILRMEIGKTIFIDSMLHLPGSLKSLAESYLRGHPLVEGDLAKGHFPHLFNRRENFDYVGPMPGKEFFDLSSMCKDDRQMREFDDWYEMQMEREDWNFRDELEKYCILDVKILAAIVLIHHREITVSLEKRDPRLKISPWHSTTSAGYVHSLILYDRELLYGGRTDEDRAENSWCNLKAEEYYFCRKALRGGRTETRIFSYDGEMMDIDICSEYPTVQLRKTLDVVGREVPVLYPVGYPTIEIFDPDYFPCKYHSKDPDERCSCLYERKVEKKSIKLRVVEKYGDMDEAEMKAYVEAFDGFIMVDLRPPRNLYHPVLPTFDKDKGKCIFGLKLMYREVFCSPELKLALKKGYTVTKIYRADRYRMARSPWSGDGDGGILGFFVGMKIRSSGDMPTDVDEQERMKEYYQRHFEMDLDFSDPSKWGSRPAAKMAAKILCNSAWGKHAESVDHEQVKILNHKSWDGSTDQELLFQSFRDGMNDMTGFVNMDNDYMMVKYRANRCKNSPHLAKSYLPCAVFVPMYGRMMLYNVLDICGMRVVMCDTDSVKVIRPIEDPMKDQRLIEMGNYLGQWEDESSKDPLVGFISLGTKTYGQMFKSGKTTFKCKGLNLKRAHQKLLNYQVAKEIYNGKEVFIPQMVFSYQFSKGMEKKNFMKKVSFDQDQLKGLLDRRTNRLYPFGWESIS